MIQAVIFDIGNVLIGWQPEHYFDAKIGSDRRHRLFAEVDLHAMNDRIDKGAPFGETVLGMIPEYPEWEAEIRMWHDHWIDLTGPVIERSVRLMRALRSKGVPVHALTNFGVETFALSCQQPQYDFLNEFDIPFVSGRMKMMKPDAEIYAAVEDRLGLPTDALLFTDDRADNIAAAQARGWQTHHFLGPDGLADTLIAQGLLTEAEAA